MIALDELIGQTPEIVAVRERVARLLQQSELGRLPPVLLQGETGTGKGLLAGAIHRASPRRDRPFVDVNCAAIPETLLEAEMFGFERGAFTDARQAKPGLFQTAHGGIIFLDEVGLLPDSLQSKLLKVIEERTVRRLGSTRSEPVDAWIMSASNEDLARAVRGRRFRQDLYHRLAVLTLWLPPLRERVDDILLLADHFLKRACADYHLPPKSLASDARAALRGYSWPGNVRELANVIERVALLSEHPAATAEVLGLPRGSEAGPRVPPAARAGLPLDAQLGQLEREQLLEVLRETEWNLSRAAARLGIPRNTLRYRLEKHGLRPGAAARADGAPAARPGPPASGAPPPPAGAGAASGGVRWEPRRLTLLRAAVVAPTSADVSVHGARLLEVVAEKAEAFGGRVEERSPTEIVAAFGLEPIEDAPRRAAHAAMAIQKAAERAGREEERPRVKVAIHVGQSLVGQGRGPVEIDLDAKREAWSVLETLLARVGPETIVVSEPAMPFLERRFDLAPLDASPATVGRAYRLVGRERSGFGVGRRTATFVGRRADLEFLQSHLASAIRGHGQAIGIVGEAGIGKSRLIAEFRQGLAGQPVTYREGMCLSYGSAIPYLPVLDILRQNCGIIEADSTPAIGEKVRRSLETVAMDPEEWAPYLLQLLGVREGTDRLAVLSPEAIKLRTLETLRRIALNASRQRPIMFVVEDLHWIDRTSEEVFASLVEHLPGVPILFVSTYRPGYRPPWIDRSYATQMALQPLSPEEGLTIVRSILPTDLPEPLARLILDKAEGNPFFLEELCRAVESQGDFGTIPAVPDTIQEVLLARIERLPDEPRRLLQTASVLGREASVRLLGAIWEGRDPLDAPLATLTALEFLHQRTAGEEPVCVFTHALTQEVAYASLAPARRQALHAAAGRALEGLYVGRLEEAYDRLAHHYSRTDEAAKAVEYLSRFADRAARSYAHEEAVRALKDALTHVRRLPPEVRDWRFLALVLRLPYSLLPLGRVPEILELLLPQEERVERLQAPSLAGHYYFLVGRACSFLGHHEQATRNARRAITEAERCGDEATMGKASSLLALEAVLSGHAPDGIEHGRRAVALLERTEERWWLADAYWLLGLACTQTGDFEPALRAEAQAQAIGAALGDPRLQASAAWVTGTIRAAMGEHAAGIQECQRGATRAPDPLNKAITMGWLGFAYLEAGDPRRAIPVLRQAIEALHRFGFREFEGWFTVFLAEAHRVGGDLDEAEELAARALQITGQAKFRTGVGWAHHALGRIARARGDLGTAESRLEEALRIFGSVHSRYELARTHVDLAAVTHARGNREVSARHLGEAYRLFETLRISRYLQRVEQLAGELGVPLPPLSTRGAIRGSG